MRFLFLQFDSTDGPQRLGTGLERLGARCDLARLFAGESIPALDAYDSLILMGGSMNAEDDEHFPYLRDAVATLRQAQHLQLLTLGVCLGGQLLARSLGVRIFQKEKTEVGYFPVDLTPDGQADPLFRGLSNPFMTLQWHEDAFTLPEGATALADSPRDTLQAFRYGRSYGIQFHPEPEPEMVASWTAGNGRYLENVATPTTPEALARQAIEVDGIFKAQTEQLCHNLVALIPAGVPT